VSISLRPTSPADLPTLFRQQSDPQSNALAGTNPRTQEQFTAIWEKIFADGISTPRVIVEGDTIVGAINAFKRNGLDYIGYWIDRPHWGRGIASQALSLFLKELPTRPLHASAARWNEASIRILEKNGFRHLAWRTEQATDRYVAGEVGDYILD
jgi:RimJ/RimL family protein N-acetyltransferase